MELLPDTIRGSMNWLYNKAIYFSGRGLLMLALFTASFTPGSGVAFYGLLVGTGLIQGLMVWNKQRQSENKLVQYYREEIAADLGVKPSHVTRDDLNKVVEGDPSIGLEKNRVLEQELERGGQRKLLQYATTIASVALAVIISGALLPPNFGELVQGFFADTPMKSLLPEDPVHVSAMVISGTIMGGINSLLDYAIEPILGLSRKTAHELIKTIKRDLAQGKVISKEQVFGVYVAADAALDATVEEHFGKRYQRLSQREQQEALEKFATPYPIERITEEINGYHIKPEELAFAAVGQESGVERVANPKKPGLQERELSVARVIDVVEQEVSDQVETVIEHEAVNDNVPGFAKRFAPREPQSFADKIKPKATQNKGFVERINARAEEIASAPKPTL